jgi:CBS domain-containing protein
MWSSRRSVRDLMTSPAVTVRAETASAEIVRLLLEHGLGGVPVVDDDDGLVGIVTESDLLLSAAYGKDQPQALALVAEIIQGRPAGWLDRVHAQHAGELMTATVTTVGPDDDIAEAARLMLRRRCGRLPVVEGGRVVGVVSRHDVLRVLMTADADGVVRSAAEPASSLTTLTHEECSALLIANAVGRVCFVATERTEVVPLRYAARKGLIVFRSDGDARLTDVASRRVLFETDAVDSTSSWSVTAIGHARDITTADGDEYESLRQAASGSSEPGADHRWIGIEITRLSGWRMRADQTPPIGAAQ